MTTCWDQFISDTDRKLAQLRGKWLTARTALEKRDWQRRIDELLSHRIQLMKNRDRSVAA